jgi:hypothetical protein
MELRFWPSTVMICRPCSIQNRLYPPVPPPANCSTASSHVFVATRSPPTEGAPRSPLSGAASLASR